MSTASPTAARRDHGFHPLTVSRVVTETEDTVSFVFAIPDDLRETFTYRSGQFCTFRVRIGDDEHLRSYSMSSAPEVDGELTLTVKRVPGGLISGWLHDNVKAGDQLETTRPTGVFCLRDSDKPVIGFAGGSGITPVLSLVKSALAGSGRDVALLYANRSAGSVIFQEVLEGLQTSYDARLRVVHHADEVAGLLTPADVEAFAAPHLADADFFLCGPTPFMDLVERTLLDLGVGADRIILERFGTTVVPPVVEEPAEPKAATALTLIVNGKKNRTTYTPGDTVLEAARRAGVATPYSCEAGNCATCMALLKKGSATMRQNNALTPEEVDEGWILTCQSTLAAEDAVIEFEAL